MQLAAEVLYCIQDSYRLSVSRLKTQVLFHTPVRTHKNIESDLSRNDTNTHGNIMTSQLSRLLSIFFLVLFLGVPATGMGKKGHCTPRASRCTTHAECCSKVCLPVEQGSTRKYCKVVSHVEQPPPGHCAAKGANCIVKSDCCSGICAGKDVKFCWDEKRVLRGS